MLSRARARARTGQCEPSIRSGTTRREAEAQPQLAAAAARPAEQAKDKARSGDSDGSAMYFYQESAVALHLGEILKFLHVFTCFTRHVSALVLHLLHFYRRCER